MKFDNESSKKSGEYIGYILMYLVFTTILYLILRFIDKLPNGWNFLHVTSITLLIILVGKSIKLVLK